MMKKLLYSPLLVLTLLIFVAGCEEPHPKLNTPTSGELVLFVDEMYGDLVRELADSFMVRTPNTSIEVREMPARAALQELVDEYQSDSARTDTSATVAAVLGRTLISDEQAAIEAGGLTIKEYILGYDGLAVAVPSFYPLATTTVAQLQLALSSNPAMLGMLEGSDADLPLRFLLPDQNSSTYMVVKRELLNDSNISAPVRYFQTSDSVLAGVLAGNGVGLLGWTKAQKAGDGIKLLDVGYVDTTGAERKPVRVHPASLVTDSYPLKQPLVGYTFARTSSLAIGFLAWMAKGQDGQRILVNNGLQPENMKLQLVLPEE